MKKEHLIREVRGLLRQTIKVRYEGSIHTEKTRVQAYADGYMRALLDAELVDRNQLLELVGEERTNSLEAA